MYRIYCEIENFKFIIIVLTCDSIRFSANSSFKWLKRQQDFPQSRFEKSLEQ